MRNIVLDLGVSFYEIIERSNGETDCSIVVNKSNSESFLSVKVAIFDGMKWFFVLNLITPTMNVHTQSLKRAETIEFNFIYVLVSNGLNSKRKTNATN